MACHIIRTIIRPSSNIRNIGIIAHVDAGKTTLTEQMLYLSNTIAHSGSVDRGTTVTDFMGEERRRGISIKSSLVTFKWAGVDINLLDTPGHVDFNYEVECALSVMDGCILIIDGCKGVQPQTLQVWRQATKYNLPSIVFVNKMDRPSANFAHCVQSTQDRLGLCPIVLHLPCNDGHLVIQDALKSSHRDDFLSAVAEKDEEFCELLLENRADDQQARMALSHLVKKGDVSVVMGGSANKAVGVTQLMDSVVEMLPSPSDTPNLLINQLYLTHTPPHVALYVYKVSHSAQHGGFMGFVRVIGGSVRGISGRTLTKMLKKDDFICWRRLDRVKITRLYSVFADEIVPVDDDLCLSFCSIVVSDGDIRTGDVFSTLKQPVGQVLDYLPRHPQRPFTANIEATDSAADRKLVQILQRVEREDSSIRVNVDDFLTITLEAVGPLHLDVIRNHIKEDHGLSTQIVKTRISYRESLLPSDEWLFPHTFSTTKHLDGRDHCVKMTMRYRASLLGKSSLLFCSQLVNDTVNFTVTHKQALRHGFDTALQAGPLIGATVEDVVAEILSFEASRGCLTSFIANSMCKYLRDALGSANMVILEPHQEYEIVCSRANMDAILVDVSARRGLTSGVHYLANLSVRIICSVPLGESTGYADQLRTITSGLVELNCIGCNYYPLSADDQIKIIDAQ